MDTNNPHVIVNEKICILYGFPCEMDFSHHESTRVDSETSGEKSISHGKPYKMHFIAYFALQGTLIMLNALRKVEYLITNLSLIIISDIQPKKLSGFDIIKKKLSGFHMKKKKYLTPNKIQSPPPPGYQMGRPLLVIMFREHTPTMAFICTCRVRNAC